MSSVVSTERLFSLAAFEGLQLIRRYMSKQPDLDLENLLVLIEKLEPDGINLDLEASVHLHEIVEEDCVLNGPSFYQSCIKAIVHNCKPVWAVAMRQGRKRFIQSLDKNDQDIFRAAGLMIDPPSWEIITWWDMVVGHARLTINLEKMLQARKAEQLTIEHEKKKLASIGIKEDPVWMGLDDNFAGYDVLSYELDGGKVTKQMIEVKSTITSPLRFILTRHEWDEALKFGNLYKFHVWDMARFPPRLFILHNKQVALHIPTDNEKGKWKHAEIPLI